MYNFVWKGICFTIICMFLGVLTSKLGATVEYTITDLGTPPGYASTYVTDINDMGQVVGQAYTADGSVIHAFMWQNGVFEDLGTLGGSKSWANGINNAGQVVGGSYTTDNWHAYIWQNGVFIDLGVGGDAYDINNAGQVVGIGAFLWQNGIASSLGSLGGSYRVAYGINDLGRVVGYSETVQIGYPDHAFLWHSGVSGGVMWDLGTLGSYENSCAYAINNAGQVVGRTWTDRIPINAADGRAFLWRGGIMQSLGTLGGGDIEVWVPNKAIVHYETSTAYDINELGQVVGTSTTSLSLYNYPVKHAFIWENGVMMDLNSLIAPSAGWILTGARGINNSGQIIGTGLFNWTQRDFLLTPVPEPSGLLALGSGLLGLAGFVRRRRA